MKRALVPTALICVSEHSEASRPTDFELTRAQPLRAGSATQSVALCEPRKRRASERPRVGCCEELARPCTDRSCRTGRIVQLKITICAVGRWQVWMRRRANLYDVPKVM